MSNTGTLTNREALLASLLMHACLLICVLLFPGALSQGRAPVGRVRDPNQPIPLEFLAPEPRPEPSDSLAMGDAGKRRASDKRPESADPPENAEPYARGNTRNRFVAPPVPDRAPPAPEPGGWPPARRDLPPPGSDAAGASPGGDEDGGKAAGERSPLDERPRFVVPAPGDDGAGGGSTRGRRGSLREALGSMSAGLSGPGGPALRYDNPVGGLSTPAGGLSFDTPGFNWGPYARRIYWIIWSNWVRGWPPAARAGLPGMVTVRFRIHRDGTISGIRVMDPSGAPGYDTCATLALEASSPLPPLPEEYTGESEGVTGRFLYNLRAPPSD